MSNQERFKSVLTDQYRGLFKKPEYAIAAKKNTPEESAARMVDSLAAGSASKSGTGIQATLKILGIKNTYKAISEYLRAS